MKYIIKLAGGGGMASFTPYINQSPQQSTSSSQTSSSEKSGDDSVMTDKIYEKLMGAGLVNDVNDFAVKMTALQNDVFGGGMFNQKSTSNYLSQIAKVNQLMENKKAWDSAVKTSEKTGGYGEAAIGTNNEVYTRGSDGRIQAISLNTYKENRDKIKLLTVSELLNARNFEAQLTGQNGVFEVANTSVGLTQISSKIHDLISALGTESTINERHYSKEQIVQEMTGLTNIKKPTQEDIKAFQVLKEISDTPGEFYKVLNENTGQKRHIEKALGYIWTVLGTNEKQKLNLATIMNGKSNPQQLILDMLNAETNSKIVSTIEPETMKNADGSTSGASGEKSLTQFQLFHKDKLMDVNNTFAMNDPKTSMLFRGVIGGVSPIITSDGKSIGMTTVSNVLTKADYNQFLEGNKVFFGNKQVDSANLTNLIYNGEDAAKVYMPVGIGGSPDFEALAKFKDLYSVYEANKDNWDTTTAKNHFKSGGYNLEFDETYENGKKVRVIRDNASVKPFLVMYGYTNDATGLTKNNPWITEFNKTDDAMIPQLEQIWTIGEGKKAKNLTPNGWGWEDYYKGMITIPYKKNATAIIDAMVGQGPKEKVSSILDVQRNINYSTQQPLNRNTSALGLN